MARKGVSFELLGLSDLRSSLDSMRDDVRARLEDAIDDTAHAIKYQARVNVPRDTGDLARAIDMSGRGLNRRVGLVDGDVSSRRGTNHAHLNPWVYGMFIEYGFKTRSAHPFMGPAVDSEEPKHNQRVDAALNAAIGGVK